MGWLLPLCWWGVIGIIWTTIVVGTGVWFWCLHLSILMMMKCDD